MASLSVCVTVKNRSSVATTRGVLPLFPLCVASLVHATRQWDGVELVVTDWSSDDWPLEKWLREAAGRLPTRVVSVDEPYFSRSRGLNLAAEHARSDQLLFIDADMLVPREILIYSSIYAQQGRAFFPICLGHFRPSPTRRSWALAGFGNVALPRAVFECVGGWPGRDEQITIKANIFDLRGWGPADRLLRDRITQHWLPGKTLEWREVSPTYWIVRQRFPRFIHQWHPVDLAWKDRYTERGVRGE